MSALPSPLVEFLVTYLIHSTLFIALVALFLRCAAPRSNPLREALWTVALFGGVITATLQTQCGVRSFISTVAVLPQPGSADPRIDLEPTLTVDRQLAAASPAGAERARAWDVNLWWIGACAAVVFSMLSLLASVIGGLRHRQPIDDGALRADLDQLCRRAAVRRQIRLTHSARLDSPVAFGLLRGEICLPTRALGELPRAQQRAMLAHELAHLLRRDPLRLLLARAVETLGFFQPLNRLARRRLFEVVECRCDAWAVAQLGDGLSLAECLTEVAGWLSVRRREPMVAMASSGSPLAKRVRRLLAEGDALAQERRWRVPSLAILAFMPLLATAAPSLARPLERMGMLLTDDDIADLRDDVGDGAVDPTRLVAETSRLLATEIDALQRELADIRHRLEQGVAAPQWLVALDHLEARVARLRHSQAALLAWQSGLVHEDGLSSAQPSDPLTTKRAPNARSKR